MTRQLSTSWTLALRIFVPTLWIAFFSTFFFATLFTDKDKIGALSMNGLRWGLLIFIAVFLFIFWKTLFRLKRIDADKEFVNATNYFKNVRYPHADIDRIELSKGLLFSYATLVLKGKGSFGDRLPFLVSRKRLAIFIADNPHLTDWIVEM